MCDNEQRRLEWFELVRRRDESEDIRKAINMKAEGRKEVNLRTDR